MVDEREQGGLSSPAADRSGRDQAVVSQPERGIYFGLDPVGAGVGALLAQGRSVSHLCDAIGGGFELDPEIGERDAAAVFRPLAAEGFEEIRE